MIALSDPWGILIVIGVCGLINLWFVVDLIRRQNRNRESLVKIVDMLDKQTTHPSEVAIEDARASERRAMLARAAWFDDHEPTRMAVIAVASCDDAHRQHVIAQWRVAMARHDAMTQVEAAKAKRPTRKRQ